VVFDTVAANCCVEPAGTVAEVGETLMVTGPDWGGFDGLELAPPPQPVNNPIEVAPKSAKQTYCALNLVFHPVEAPASESGTPTANGLGRKFRFQPRNGLAFYTQCLVSSRNARR